MKLKLRKLQVEIDMCPRCDGKGFQLKYEINTREHSYDSHLIQEPCQLCDTRGKYYPLLLSWKKL